MDYRDIPPHFVHAFDAFVSIEMLEHVGSHVRSSPYGMRNNGSHLYSQYYKQYFKLVDRALKPTNATAVVSASTFPECRYTGYQYVSVDRSPQTYRHILMSFYRAQDFMRKYMWPNSCLPSATALISAANAGSQGRFTLENVENHAARASYQVYQ